MKIFGLVFSILCLVGCGCLAVVQIVKTIDFFKSRKRDKQEKIANTEKGD